LLNEQYYLTCSTRTHKEIALDKCENTWNILATFTKEC
jgi:hypothetical protein